AEFELIVVDDGSTDGTWPELQRMAAKAPGIVRVLRTENRGVAAARNVGIAMAKAPLTAFLDSDDLWAPDKLARQVEFMDLHPRCEISQTGEIWLRHGQRVNPGARHRKRGGDIFIDSLRTCLVSPSAVILRTAYLREVGGFDEDMTAAEDYDLWLRILVNHEAGYIDEPLVTRRAGHPDQLSATVAAIDRFRILALLKLLTRTDLAAARREAVCDILAEKSAIYAKGLARRGHKDAADLIPGLRAGALGAWRTGAGEGLASALAAMRSHVEFGSIAGLGQ
ncbi:MAG TPA: glycosyltransferase family A protein, partial [Candidatus Binataceae bacterium]|nr:glycosyltransferase family A protein [Candidatus Binataceae bacterium]